MAKYAISIEGAESLRGLADKLCNSTKSIVDASSRLMSQICSLDESIGIYSEEIQGIVNRNNNDLATHQDVLNELISRLRAKSDEILGLFGLDDRYDAGTHGANERGSAYATTGGHNEIHVNALALNRSAPRDLGLGNTQYGYKLDSDGNLFYDSPMETNSFLYTTQGAAYQNYQGTCGLCSCVNVIRLSGVNMSEKEMIDYAANARTGNTVTPHLCDTGFSDPGMNGGTSPLDRQQILSHYGIDSGLFDLDAQPLNQISQFVSEGRGVIISVHADTLWYNDYPDPENGDLHAVTVTSIKKDCNGRILGLYICDSAQGGTKFYSAERVLRALSSAPMNVTYQVIR